MDARREISVLAARPAAEVPTVRGNVDRSGVAGRTSPAARKGRDLYQCGLPRAKGDKLLVCATFTA
jgi:hypothetical protein